MSFAVEPAGRPRQDFSTNDRTTFPINDAHAFATTVKVVTASSMGAGIRALPFRDKLSFARTAILGAEQEHQSLIPYQRRRYWSTVPYRHGPTDVIKYSLTPCVGNPAADLEEFDPNTLQDELVRHLETDTVMSCFDFGLQLLDPQVMTYWGRRRDANFWIENASVEWKESQAPFHTVARLTLARQFRVAASHLRSVAHRCDRELDSGYEAAWQHQPRALARRNGESEGAAGAVAAAGVAITVPAEMELPRRKQTRLSPATTTGFPGSGCIPGPSAFPRTASGRRD